MQASLARGAQAYYQTQVHSRSPVELVVMLYDGALRFLAIARDAMVSGDVVARRDAVSRTQAILSELQSTLNMSAGGDVAASLNGLYGYINGKLLDATAKGDLGAIEESITLLRPLRDAWAEVAAAPPVDAPRART